MQKSTNLYDNIIKAFHQIISKRLELNNKVYTSDLGLKIANILLEDDEQNKRLFFDAFKNVQTCDKRKIINVCLFDIVSKIDILICNSNKTKVDEIIDYIDKNDRNLIINVYNFLNNKDYKDLPKELLTKLKKLNPSEILIVKSMCLNICRLTFSGINNLLTSITNDFYINPQNHKEEITELLRVYAPIYDTIKYIDSPKIEDRNDFVTIYPITYNLKLFIQKNNRIAKKTLSQKMIIYYLFYEFLIHLEFDENSKNYINEVLLMIKNDDLDMDNDTLEYLLNFCKMVIDCYSLEEKIQSIQELKDSDISPIINLYASFDIAEYKKLEKKKKAFGL